jgi:SRSO17 transposase
MDAAQIRRLKAMLTRYLKQFDDCFARRDTRAHLPVYVRGQLSDLSAKSCEPIALHAGVPPRTLQEFLAQHRWDENGLRNRLREIIVSKHAGPNSIGIIDETSDVKKGDKTPGVQRQWCGTVGKTENCLVTVHLGYATGDFHCLVDGELFLPESWSEDRQRCREAGIPDGMVYRPKWKIALELYDRGTAGGLEFDWFGFDEGYGSKPAFLRALDERGQLFVGEVPTTFTGWLTPPRVTHRPFRRGVGRGRKTPRLVSGSPRAIALRNMLKYSPELRDQPWVGYYVKDGQKGPIVWEAKHALITIKDENELPGIPLHLVVARNLVDKDEVKYFLSNGPPETSVAAILLVGFSRWRVERCFQDQKQEIGLDQWEGRRYLGLKRHLILSCISYLFLATVREHLREKKSGVNSLSDPHSSQLSRTILVAQWTCISKVDRSHCQHDPIQPTKKRPSSQKPYQKKTQETSRNGHQNEKSHTLQMAMT